MNNKGYSLLLVLTVVTVIGSMIFFFSENLCAVGALMNKLQQKGQESSTKENARLCVEEHFLNQFINGDVGHRRPDRLKNVIAWGFSLPESSIQANIGEVVSIDTTMRNFATPNNPFSLMNGYIFQQDCDLNIGGNRLKERVFLKEIPATEVEFIHPFYFEPKKNTIPIEVNGIAICDAIIFDDGTNIFTCNNLISSFSDVPYSENKCVTVRKTPCISPLRKFCFGTHPNNVLLEPTRQEHHFIPAQHITVNISFDGKAIDNPTLRGLSVQEFDGINRLVIDPNACTCKNIKIYCSSEKSTNAGIVVLGSSEARESELKVISTNGRVWLHGSHLGSPLAIGSTHSHWTFTDLAWTREAIPYAQLNFKWNGYLSCTKSNITFSSPQSSTKNGTLEIRGTLMLCGILSGNLGKVTINESHEKQKLAPFVERMKTFIDIKSL